MAGEQGHPKVSVWDWPSAHTCTHVQACSPYTRSEAQPHSLSPEPPALALVSVWRPQQEEDPAHCTLHCARLTPQGTCTKGPRRKDKVCVGVSECKIPSCRKGTALHAWDRRDWSEIMAQTHEICMRGVCMMCGTKAMCVSVSME